MLSHRCRVRTRWFLIIAECLDCGWSIRLWTFGKALRLASEHQGIRDGE